jgi:PAS domain S-box-containing protein
LVYTEQRSGPIYDATGNVIGRHGTIQDISEQMRAEEALRTSEQLLRLLSDTLPAAISYIEKSGRFRFVNKSMEDWYGRPRDEFVGMGVLELIGEESYAILAPYFHRALAGESVKFDLQRDYPTIGRRTMEITYVPEFSSDGSIPGIFGMAQDVTERRAAEEALRDSEARLAEAQRIANLGSWEQDISSGKEQWSDQHFEYMAMNQAPSSQPTSIS